MKPVPAIACKFRAEPSIAAKMYTTRRCALIVLNPGSIGRAYFEEIAKAASGAGKPDPPRLTEIMMRYGLVPA